MLYERTKEEILQRHQLVNSAIFLPERPLLPKPKQNRRSLGSINKMNSPAKSTSLHGVLEVFLSFLSKFTHFLKTVGKSEEGVYHK